MTIREISYRSILIFSVLIFCISEGLQAQQDKRNTADLKTEAATSFSSGNYPVALEQYKSLLKRYPKDGMFSYYCGLSLLNMNKDLNQAIEYLEFSASRATVPNTVFYYLGDAYTRNYEFSKAKKAYTKFSSVASKTEAKELMPARRAEMSANAVEQTESYNSVDVIASSLFTFRDSAYTRQIRAQGGTLVPKPAELFPRTDDPEDLTNLVFLPRNIEKGETVFFAGYEKNKKRGAEIFVVKTLNGRKFSEPLAVEELNTEYDEILPYFDPISKDLYFASKGHNSMGGFDLFKAHYDAERNIWTPPVNLGFPVNSPLNEYIVIPGTDLGSIMLITDRQGLDSMITAYMLRIHEPRKPMAAANPPEVKKIGNFGGIETIPYMLDMAKEDILPVPVKKPAPAPAVAAANRPKPAEAGTKLPAETNNNLRLALEQQFRADSLSGLASEARIRVKEIADPDERWEIQKKIISWEKQAGETQAKADEYYLAVKQSETGGTEIKTLPTALEKDTVIHDITVYKFKKEEAIPEENKESAVTAMSPEPEVSNPVPGEPGEIVAPAKSSGDVMNRFVILGKSPYSAANPFPEDVNLPKGAYYKIQLAVLGKNAAWDAFAGLSPVTFETVEGKPLKKYYAGKFVNYDKAKIALEEVRRKGYPEAFIVSWYDGLKMTVSKVMELEKK